jgi:hypothetical protein
MGFIMVGRERLKCFQGCRVALISVSGNEFTFLNLI